MSFSQTVTEFAKIVEKAIGEQRALLSQTVSHVDLNHTFGFVQGLSKSLDLLKQIDAQAAAASTETLAPLPAMTPSAEPSAAE